MVFMGGCRRLPVFLLSFDMPGYRDLDIYKESKRLAILIHAMSLQLPKLETYEEGSQIRRSSKSVTSNIVEGYNRRAYPRDYIKHLVYSHAECDETLLHLDFLYETKSLRNEEVFKSLKNEYELLSKRIHAFIVAISRQI